MASETLLFNLPSGPTLSAPNQAGFGKMTGSDIFSVLIDGTAQVCILRHLARPHFSVSRIYYYMIVSLL